MAGKYNRLNQFQLTEADNAQGTVDMLLWYCEKGDNDCEDEREEEWKKHDVPTRVVNSVKFDCQQGCHTLLDPARGRLTKTVERAQSHLMSAIGSAASAERYKEQQEEFDAQSDAAAIAAFEAEHHDERKRLQEEWMKSEELEEAADEAGDKAQQNREASWAKAAGLARQLAAIDALGAEMCSTSPTFGKVLKWAAEPLYNFVYNPRNNYLEGLYH